MSGGLETPAMDGLDCLGLVGLEELEDDSGSIKLRSE